MAHDERRENAPLPRATTDFPPVGSAAPSGGRVDAEGTFWGSGPPTGSGRTAASVDERNARKFRVVRYLPPSTVATAPPLAVQEGDSLEVVRQDDTWTAFLLVRTTDGRRGWVPGRYLRRTGDAAVAKRAYDTTTLEPQVGDLLDALEEDAESGWRWCRDRHGREGWFPTEYVTPA